MDNFVWDKDRKSRTGVAEAIFCANKQPNDLRDIIQFNLTQKTSVLLTRLTPEQWSLLPKELHQYLDYDECSHTAILNVDGVINIEGSVESRVQSNAESSVKHNTVKRSGICIVTAGTSDLNVAKEAQRTLTFNGFDAPIYADIGVAGLWRLMDKIEDIRQHKIIIALAGMEGALFSVLSGLVSAPVIAVPTSVGYGVSSGGKVALESALASCSPGILTVNIDNGFGAANAAIKIMKQFNEINKEG